MLVDILIKRVKLLSQHPTRSSGSLHAYFTYSHHTQGLASSLHTLLSGVQIFWDCGYQGIPVTTLPASVNRFKHLYLMYLYS